MSDRCADCEGASLTGYGADLPAIAGVAPLVDFVVEKLGDMGVMPPRASLRRTSERSSHGVGSDASDTE